MPKLILVFAALALTAAAADRTVTYQGDLSPLNIMPTFDHGYVIAFERNPDAANRQNQRFAVYAPTGLLAYDATLQVVNQPAVTILNFTADTDGTVVVAFHLPDGFAVFNPGGKQIRTVLTGRYTPTQVCIAADHTIWLAGNQFATDDYAIFRHYSLDGIDLGHFQRQSELGGLRAVQIIGGRAIRAAQDRIVALLLPASKPGPIPYLEWVELDLAGQVIGRPGRHRSFFPWMLTPDGTIYASEGDGKWLYYDRASAAWKPSAIAGHFRGADETSLIFQLPNSNTFEWLPR